MALRVRATATAACCSSALAESLADSASTSMKPPSALLVPTLESACVAGESVRPGPGCLYIFFPAGAGTSKLANAVIERRLKVRGTMRNWNTVGKLLAALEGTPS